MLEVIGRRVLVVMARYPAPGTVKTRLAARIGAEGACALHRAFLADIAARFANDHWMLVWAVHPPGADLRDVVGGGAHCVAQQGADLAERMRECFRLLYGAGAAQVMMLGADAPHLSPASIAAGFDSLGEADVALVPTQDGGYCAIAMRAAFDLFSGVEMGTARVLAQTLASAARQRLRVVTFPQTFDVDEWEDLLRLGDLLRNGTARLPETARLLDSWAHG